MTGVDAKSVGGCEQEGGDCGEDWGGEQKRSSTVWRLVMEF